MSQSFAQTPDGYLWIGTEEGLASFDGYDFTTFNRRSGALPNDLIDVLADVPVNTVGDLVTLGVRITSGSPEGSRP